jgi:hypothetical protein
LNIPWWYFFVAGVEVAFGEAEYTVIENDGGLTISVDVVNNVTLDREFQVNVTTLGNGTHGCHAQYCKCCNVP